MSLICVICIEALVKPGPPNPTDEGILTTKCGHMYHAKCLKDWVSHSWPVSTCPTCQKRIRSKKHLMRIYPPESDDRTLEAELALANAKVSNLEDSLVISELEANKISRELAEVSKERDHFREEASNNDMKATLWKNEFETVLCHHRTARCSNPGIVPVPYEESVRTVRKSFPECIDGDRDGQSSDLNISKAAQAGGSQEREGENQKPCLGGDLTNSTNGPESLFYPVQITPGTGFCIETKDRKALTKTFVNFLISEDIGLQSPSCGSGTCPVKVEKFHVGRYENASASLVEMIISPATFACTSVTPHLIQHFFIQHVYSMLKDKGGLDVDCLHIKIFKDTKMSVTEDPTVFQLSKQSTGQQNLLKTGTVVRGRTIVVRRTVNVIPSKRAKISNVASEKTPEVVTLD